jgi:hypothetical protein
VNAKAQTQAETMPYTEELTESGGVTVVIVTEHGPGRAETFAIAARPNQPELDLSAIPAPDDSSSDIVDYLADQAETDSLNALIATLGPPAVLIRPSKAEPAPAPGHPEASTATARIEIEIQSQ